MRRAVVALGLSGANGLHLAEEAGSAALDEWHIGGDTHAVDVPPRREVVEGAEHHVKLAVEGEAELGCLDVAVVRDDLDAGVKGTCRRLGDLGLRLLDVLLLEEELPVQVREVNGVEVDLGERCTYDLEVAHAQQDEVLEHLAPDAACTDYEHACRREARLGRVAEHRARHGIAPGSHRDRKIGAWIGTPTTMRASLVRGGVHAARSVEHLRLFSASHAALDVRKVPEHEYQVRVGAAIRHLRATLPQFMERALVDREENGASDALAPYLSTYALMARARASRIYHPDMHFRFCPPLPQLPESLPGKPPFKPAFSLRGRQVYLMSAKWLRWTLRTLFTETHIRIEQLSLLPNRASAVAVDAAPGRPVPRDELLVRIRFRGASRVSGTLRDYSMVFRYRFDRMSGMICEHYVDQMMPIPGSRMWQALPRLGRGGV